MAEEPKNAKLSKVDVTPATRITEDVDNLLHNAASGAPSNEQSMADEHQDLTNAEDKGFLEESLDEIAPQSAESSASAKESDNGPAKD